VLLYPPNIISGISFDVIESKTSKTTYCYQCDSSI